MTDVKRKRVTQDSETGKYITDESHYDIPKTHRTYQKIANYFIGLALGYHVIQVDDMYQLVGNKTSGRKEKIEDNAWGDIPVFDMDMKSIKHVAKKLATDYFVPKYDSNRNNWYTLLIDSSGDKYIGISSDLYYPSHSVAVALINMLFGDELRNVGILSEDGELTVELLYH